MVKTSSMPKHAKTLLAGIAVVALTTAIVMSTSTVEKSWAQDMPPQPLAINTPTPETGVAEAPVVAAPTDLTAAPTDPAAGVPSTGTPALDPAATGVPGAETQSSNGTYAALNPEDFTKLDEAMTSMNTMRENTMKPGEVGTLVFTLWQHSLLQDAKKLFVTRRPTESEIAAAADGSAVEEARPRGIREISLSGILYKGKDNWVVWLNGQRLDPNAIPKEVMDIQVHKDYISLKWFDSYTNLIYPIRLRPHQRFNLDSRIFLPGITADAAAQLQAASTAN